MKYEDVFDDPPVSAKVITKSHKRKIFRADSGESRAAKDQGKCCSLNNQHNLHQNQIVRMLSQ